MVSPKPPGSFQFSVSHLAPDRFLTQPPRAGWRSLRTAKLLGAVSLGEHISDVRLAYTDAATVSLSEPVDHAVLAFSEEDELIRRGVPGRACRRHGGTPRRSASSWRGLENRVEETCRPSALG